MSIQIEQQPSSDVVVVRISGRVSSAEWEKALRSVAELLKSKAGKISLLVDGRGFAGWDPGQWGDLWFQQEHDAQIRKLAVVVEDQWADRVALFAGKGLRKLDMKTYSPQQLEEARTWAAASAPIYPGGLGKRSNQ